MYSTINKQKIVVFKIPNITAAHGVMDGTYIKASKLVDDLSTLEYNTK